MAHNIKMIQDNTFRHLLTGVIDSIDGGAAIYDVDDRLLQCNDNYLQYFSLVEDIMKPGVLFSETYKAVPDGTLYEGADGYDWVVQRQKFFDEGAKGTEFQSTDGRWIQIDYYKLDGGGTFIRPVAKVVSFGLMDNFV